MGAIAAFILGIACINFVNLSTARATLRGKEVGMRKTMGAVRSQLVTQFLGESFLLTFLAFVLALVVVSLTLPSLNGLMGKAIELNLAQHLNILLIFTAIFLAVGLVSGLYPAFYLSRFRPILVLKGKNHPQGSLVQMRRGLVVFQFAVAIVLIIGTLTVLSQLHYLQSKHLGFNQEQVVVVPLRTPEAVRKYEALRNALGQQPQVTSVSGASEYPGREHPIYTHWAEGAPQEQMVLLNNGAVGFGYFQTMQMELKAGRYFSEAFPTDERQAVVINEEAAKLLGYGNEAIGKKIYHDGPNNPKREWRTVIGIVKNFHSHSPHVPIEPLFIIPRKEVTNLMVRVQTGKVAQAMAAMEDAFRKINPDLPFEASFLDQEFARAYRAEERLSTLVKTFTFLAILISCLGLLGLISFTVDQKMKEIGVRKVLGAQTAHIVYLLSKESLLYVGLAWLVASPAAYFLMDKWLQGYPYRVALQPGTYILAGVAALTVALLTISYQTLKAARANPVRWLRNE